MNQCVWYQQAQRHNESERGHLLYSDIGCFDCDGTNKQCDRYSQADGYLLSKLNTNTSLKVKHNRQDSYEDEAMGVFY